MTTNIEGKRNKLEMNDIHVADIEPKMLDYSQVNEKTLTLMRPSSQYLEIEIPPHIPCRGFCHSCKIDGRFNLVAWMLQGENWHQRTKYLIKYTFYNSNIHI